MPSWTAALLPTRLLTAILLPAHLLCTTLLWTAMGSQAQISGFRRVQEEQSRMRELLLSSTDALRTSLHKSNSSVRVRPMSNRYVTAT